MEWDGWCNRIGVQWEGIASCGATFDSVLEQHWLQDHMGSNYHTHCTESTASPAFTLNIHASGYAPQTQAGQSIFVVGIAYSPNRGICKIIQECYY